MSKLTLVLVALTTVLLQAQSTNDLPALGVLKASDRSLLGLKVWRRVPVTDELDLVLAVGKREDEPFWEVGDWIGWGQTRKLALLLQERALPQRVYSLAIRSGSSDCAAHLLRATATDTIISCTGEKSDLFPHQKFVYDVRAKALVSHFFYAPFLMYRATSPRAGTSLIEGTNGTDKVVVEFALDRVPEFRVISKTKDPLAIDGAVMNRGQAPDRSFVPPRFGPADAFTLVQMGDPTEPELVVQEVQHSWRRSYRLPRSSYEEFAGARPERVRDGLDRFSTQFADQIGPWQVEGGTLWFGKTFYDGEGLSGIGGFGYFDAAARTYRVLTSPMIADWSVSAIHVEPEAVWIALALRTEYGGPGGGAVRYDRRSEAFQRFETGGSIGQDFARVGDRLLLATDMGITVFQDNQVSQYIVDRTTDGRLRVAAAQESLRKP